MLYTDRLVCERTQFMIDESNLSAIEALRSTDHETFPTICKDPKTIAAINAARKVELKDVWRVIDKTKPFALTDAQEAAAKAVWLTMPDYASLADAVNIIGRL